MTPCIYGRRVRAFMGKELGFCLLVLAFMLTGAMLSACNRAGEQSGGARAQAPVPVMVERASRMDVPIELRAVGNVEAFATVTVKSQVEGELFRAYFKEGEEVKKGDLVFLIDTRPFEAAVKEAQANLARDTAQLKKAKADADRYEDLYSRGVASEEERDRMRTNFEALKATVEADKATLETAKLRLSYCYIRSPIDGRLGELKADEGNLVKEKDTEIAVINQIKPVYVSFAVPEENLGAIREQMSRGALSVEASPPASSGKSEGRLVFINNEVDKKTGTILLKALFPNEDELLWPGQFVNVRLKLATQQGAVVVPFPAVQLGQQ
ncbi:MAG: efflux RND transporter periplasmic adaptor subunit, partial [Candidatus Methanosuratincola sp.]